MNSTSAVFPKKLLIPFLILFVVLFIYGLWQRSPDIDDAWLGEHAYYLAKDGYVHSELMRGVNLQEERFVVHHKFFTLHGALFIKIFGFSLNTLKSVSLFYFLIFLILFYYYTVRKKKNFTTDQFLFALIIVFSFHWTYKYSFLYRPEIMMMTYGFTGYIFLEDYLEKPIHQFWKLCFSGLLFGLTMATHLNGLILLMAAGLMLLWEKKFVATAVFGLFALLASLVYFYDYTSLSFFELWRHQFFDSPSLDSLSSGPVYLKPVINLLREHIRYFHSPQIMSFSFLMIVTIFVGFKYLHQNYTRLLRFTLLLVFIMGIVAMHKSQQYILLIFPYYIILITLTINELFQGKLTLWPVNTSKRRKLFQYFLIFLFGLFILGSSFYNIGLAINKFSPESNKSLAEKYTVGDVSKMNIVAPMDFIFNELKHFNRIQGDLCYIELQKLDSSIKGAGFLEKATYFDINLIMVSKQYQDRLGLSEFRTGDSLNQFMVIDKNDQLLVFKRLHK